MYEGQITHTIIMTFKDAVGTVRSIKVPNARPNVTGREVRRVMEYIVSTGVFLSRKGLPLVKMVKATLVTVRMIFLAAKAVPKTRTEHAQKSQSVHHTTASVSDSQASVRSKAQPSAAAQSVKQDKQEKAPAAKTNILFFPGCNPANTGITFPGATNKQGNPEQNILQFPKYRKASRKIPTVFTIGNPPAQKAA